MTRETKHTACWYDVCPPQLEMMGWEVGGVQLAPPVFFCSPFGCHWCDPLINAS